MFHTARTRFFHRGGSSDRIVACLGTTWVIALGFLITITLGVLVSFWQVETAYWQLGSFLFGIGFSLAYIAAPATDAESKDIRARLSKLYDALETGKVSPDDLGPRISELRVRQNQLSKTRVQVEADIVAQGTQQRDAEVVKSYVQDLRSLPQR